IGCATTRSGACQCSTPTTWPCSRPRVFPLSFFVPQFAWQRPAQRSATGSPPPDGERSSSSTSSPRRGGSPTSRSAPCRPRPIARPTVGITSRSTSTQPVTACFSRGREGTILSRAARRSLSGLTDARRSSWPASIPRQARSPGSRSRHLTCCGATSRRRSSDPQTMTTKPQSGDPQNAAPDVAKLGLVRPPLVYLISLAAGALVQIAMPVPFLPGTLTLPLGTTLVVLSIALFSYSVAKFRAARTPVPARKPTTVIVRTGPYRFSRNPIYLAFSVLQLGIAIWVNSLWLLASLVGAVALIHCFVIPREEQYLERRFGAQSLQYKASVRRWL